MTRVNSIEYIRGLAMLGVLGIHTGAWSLSTPGVNLHLFALLEIVSRFSVPIFFFITAFGLFYRRDALLTKGLAAFPAGRIRKIAVPYLFWSLLYMVQYSLRYSDNTIWSAPKLCEFLLFGLASYQLYFLVLLLVFLASTPLFAPFAIWLKERPLWRLGWLLVLQIAFNLLSERWPGVDLGWYWLDLLSKHRLNYLPLYYLWIYMLGAVFALNYAQWLSWLEKHRRSVYLAFWVSLALMLAAYYWVVLGQGRPLEQAAFTIHQLSPMGVIYTGATSLYLSLVLARPLGALTEKTLTMLADHSFFVFLVHPFVMTWLADQFAVRQIGAGSFAVFSFYLGTLTVSLALSAVMQLIVRLLPLLSLTLTGKAPVSRRQSM